MSVFVKCHYNGVIYYHIQYLEWLDCFSRVSNGGEGGREWYNIMSHLDTGDADNFGLNRVRMCKFIKELYVQYIAYTLPMV